MDGERRRGFRIISLRFYLILICTVLVSPVVRATDEISAFETSPHYNKETELSSEGTTGVFLEDDNNETSDGSEWRNHPGKSSFEMAPGTSTIVLGTFFCLSLSLFSFETKSTRFGILFAIALTLTVSAGFWVPDTLWGNAQLAFTCEDVWSKNLGVGVLLGLFLAMAIRFLRSIVAAEKSKHAFSEHAVPFHGTVVQKSTRPPKGEGADLCFLHIRYDDFDGGANSGLPRSNYHSCGKEYQELELGQFQKSDTIHTITAIPVTDSLFSTDIPVVKWSYYLDDRWVNHDDDCNAKLEAAFQEGGQFSPAITDRSIVVDFSAMMQTNASTGLSQEVQRIVVSLPTTTTTTDSSLLMQPDGHNFVIPSSSTGGYIVGSSSSSYPNTFVDSEKPYLEENYFITIESNNDDDENTQSTIFRPFPVCKTTYDNTLIGDTVDILCVPGHPFFSTVKSEFELANSGKCFAILFVVPMCNYPVPLGLGLYLPIRILNWEFCRASVIVCMSTMVITAALVLFFACPCFSDPPLTSEGARDMIQMRRDRETHGNNSEEEELRQSCIQRRLAALAFLEDKVIQLLDDGGSNKAHHEFVLTRFELLNYLHLTLYQVDISAGRAIPDVTVVLSNNETSGIIV